MCTEAPTIRAKILRAAFKKRQMQRQHISSPVTGRALTGFSMEATTDLFVVCAHEKPLDTYVHLIQPSTNSTWSLSLQHISTAERLLLNLERLPALLKDSFLLNNRQEATTQLSALNEALLKLEALLPIVVDEHHQLSESNVRGLPITVVSVPDCRIHLNAKYGTVERTNQTSDFARVFEKCLSIAAASPRAPAGELHRLRRRLDAIRYNLKIGTMLPEWHDNYADPVLTSADRILEICTAFRTVGMALQLTYLLNPDDPLPSWSISEPLKRMVCRKNFLRHHYYDDQPPLALLRCTPPPPPRTPTPPPPPTAPKEKRPRANHD